MGAYSCVAVPGVKVDVRDRVAGVGVNDLEVQEQRNTSLVLRDVLANQLTSDICSRLTGILV